MLAVLKVILIIILFVVCAFALLVLKVRFEIRRMAKHASAVYNAQEIAKHESKLTAEEEQRLLAEIKKISAVSAVKITAQKSDHLPLCVSKFGGMPYWDTKMPYPTDNKGNKLILLAQLNFAEIPHLSDFPETGLLQIFLSPDEKEYYNGLDWKNPQQQNGWRVVYHDKIDENISEQSLSALNIPAVDTFNFLVIYQYQLSFELTESYQGTGNLEQFKSILKQAAQTLEISLSDDEIENWDAVLSEEFIDNSYRLNAGHWIGGYPFLIDKDPREKGKYRTLLLQIDAEFEESNIDIMEAGMGQFFIEPEDLKKRDFSRVLYNWDCY